MKNKSIKFKLTLWFSIMLVIAVALTFFIVRLAGGIVLMGTTRKYLTGMVEENTNKIKYVETKDEQLGSSIYIEHGEGFLVIDSDFLDRINDVSAALYTEEGTMIYGENPLEKQLNGIGFTASRLWHIEVNGEAFDIYDRQISPGLPDNSSVWIRGILSRSAGLNQLNEITRISLVVIPVLLILLVFSAYVLSDRLLSPLKKIETTAAQISAGYDLKKRIEVGKSKDEVGHLADMFNGMLDRLEHSFNTERQFTSDASHELRTPTAVIMSQAEYTLEKDRTKEEYVEALEVIDSQSKRMNVLLNDMLDYTRMDQNSERYEMKEMDISKLVSEMADQMAMLKEKNISLTKEVEPWLMINGNEVLMGRLLQNLIGNAYKYGVENGNIKVRLVKQDDKACLEVEDDGEGISKEEQDKIFDRFYQSDKSRNIKGAGLGLSMVKRIVELHRGEITVESEEGKGSLFRVFIPLV